MRWNEGSKNFEAFATVATLVASAFLDHKRWVLGIVIASHVASWIAQLRHLALQHLARNAYNFHRRTVVHCRWD